METLKGIPVSPGVAIGTAHVMHSEETFNVPARSVAEDDISKEIARFEEALTRTRAEILGIRKKIAVQLGRESSDIFNAHLMILEDRTLIEDVIALMKQKKVNCEYSFATILQRYFKAFHNINDEYIRERVAWWNDDCFASVADRPPEIRCVPRSPGRGRAAATPPGNV